MKRIINEFTSNTSGHGWGMINQTSSKFGKALWVAITLLSTIAAIIWVSTIIVRYVKYETIDRVEAKVDEDIIFPSVTVCPLYGISSMKIAEVYSDPNSDYISLNNFLSSSYALVDELAQITNETYLSIMTNTILVARSNRGYYANLGVSGVSTIGHEFGDFIPYCLYQEKECSAADFQKLVHHEYKNCYTFNGGDINISKPIISSTGAQKGLSLTLYLENSENAYVAYNVNRVMTAASGARVIIHEKGTLPDPDNEGFDVEPGHLISVALSANKRQLLKQPWGECAEHNTLHSTDYKYTRNTCRIKCIEKVIQRQCGCRYDLLPVDINATTELDIQPCGKFNIKEWLKATEANTTVLKEDLAKVICSKEEHQWTALAKDIPSCECEYNCTYVDYEIETSQSVWPMRGSELDFFCQLSYLNISGSFFERFQNSIGIHCNSFMEYINVAQNHGDELRANVLRVNVYFKTLEVKYTIQDEGFSLVSMISEIGGVLGIFVGVSIITILEIFVLCSGIVHVIINSKKVSSEINVKEIKSTSKSKLEESSNHKPDDSYYDQFKKY
ncbi:unnamed protein product [Owenia fusiformis]|uniref:Uncharacterized protein n=1 Tax=Owenia fusiformis TaxID=6347 RepID=A0A8J1XKZ3_OWEFU|nr:unnamed protein product [Owenia fusiformis]